MFGRPIERNQGVQFPITDVFIETEAANTCLQTHGGFGFAHEYDVGHKFRETCLYQQAPISTNLIQSYVAEHLLGLPRSF